MKVDVIRLQRGNAGACIKVRMASKFSRQLQNVKRRER